MAKPNTKLYEELIEKEKLAIADESKKPYIFSGTKFLPINFNNMTVREAINYLTCLYNIIGTVDADHQKEFELNPIVDHLFGVAYKIYKNGKNNIEKWSEISAAQKNICRACINPFLDMLGLKADPNTVDYDGRLFRGEQNLKAAFDDGDIKLINSAEIPALAQDIVEANEHYSILYPNPIPKRS